MNDGFTDNLFDAYAHHIQPLSYSTSVFYILFYEPCSMDECHI